MMKEHERVVLTRDLPEEKLQAGDVGVIVQVHGGNQAFEVEIFALNGNTIVVTMVDTRYLRSVTAQDVSHPAQWARRRRMPFRPMLREREQASK